MSNKDKKDGEKAPEAAPEVDPMAAAVERALEKTLPMAMMAMAQVLKPAPIKTDAPPSRNELGRCSECLQYKKACKGKHIKMVVGPRNHRRWKSWQGVYLNSVHYKSPGPGVEITVPLEQNFAYIIARWEEEEDNLREGRTMSHNSGKLSPKAGKSRTRRANPQGFRGNLSGEGE